MPPAIRVRRLWQERGGGGLVLTLAGVAALVLLARRLPWSFASFSWLAVVLGMLKTYYGGRKAVVGC